MDVVVGEEPKEMGRQAMSIIKRSLICIVITAHLCACVTPAPEISKEQRSKIGTVEVVALSEPISAYEEKVSRGMLVGGGALLGVYLGATVGFLGCTVALFSLTPNDICDSKVILVGAGLGAVLGLVVQPSKKEKSEVMAVDYLPLLNAVPGEGRGQIETQLRVIFENKTEFQSKLRSEVVSNANSAGVHDVTEIANNTPVVVGQGVDHQPIPAAKANTLLEVGFVSMAFINEGEADPKQKFHIDALARLVDGKTHAELYRHSFTYESNPRRASEWNANGAQLIKQAIMNAYQSIGQSIADDIFLVERTN